MLTRRELLATAAAALAATPAGRLAQVPRRRPTARDPVSPTSPNPVSTKPSDNLGGSTINVGSNPGDLQRAINTSAQGDTLVVPAGVTYNPITLPIRTGSGWTCIRTNSGKLPTAGTRVSATNANAMFKVESGGELNAARAVTMPAGTQGWRFIGMEATHPNDNFEYGLIDVLGARLSLERCYIHGTTTSAGLRRCVWLQGASDFQIWDSWVSEAREVGSDSQAIASRNVTRWHVENCELQGAGENILVDDQGSPTPSLDVTLKRNHFFKPLTWFPLLIGGVSNPAFAGTVWTIKNIFEIKWAYRVLVEGNVFENNWGGAQDGTAILLNGGRCPGPKDIRTEDLMFRSNIVRNAPYFLSVGISAAVGGLPGGLPHARVAFLNNLVLQVPGRVALLNHYSNDVWFEHNTIMPMDAVHITSGATSFYIASDFPGTSWPRLTLKNNVWGRSKYAFMVENFPTTSATFDRLFPDRSFIQNVEFGLPGTAPAGLIYYVSAAAAGVDTVTGRLKTGSPLINAASDGTDIGVNFTQLHAAQTGTSTNARAPTGPPS